MGQRISVIRRTISFDGGTYKYFIHKAPYFLKREAEAEKPDINLRAELESRAHAAFNAWQPAGDV